MLVLAGIGMIEHCYNDIFVQDAKVRCQNALGKTFDLNLDFQFGCEDFATSEYWLYELARTIPLSPLA